MSQFVYNMTTFSIFVTDVVVDEIAVAVFVATMSTPEIGAVPSFDTSITI